MSILILNRYPTHLVHFQEWLKDCEEDLLMLTTERYADSFQNYAVSQGVPNYLDDDDVLKVALRLHAETPFRAVIALDEVDISRAALLREQLGLPGQGVESALAFRDKVHMKTIARKNGILCPEFASLESPSDLTSFAAHYGFPIVIKPVDGMGAINTLILRTSLDVETWLAENECTGMMVETFVEGEMYEVDGLWIQGALRFCSAGRYHHSLLSYQSQSGILTELLSPDDPMYHRLHQFAQQVLISFPTPDVTSFHCEVFLTSSGELMLCEIASRSPGARITECIRQSYGVELDKWWTQLTCGLPDELPTDFPFQTNTAVYLIPKRTGRLASMITSFPFDWVTEYQPRVRLGYCNEKGMSHCNDTIGSVVFEASSREELLERYNTLLQYIESHVSWEKQVQSNGGSAL